MTVREVVKKLEADGWIQVRVTGSHRTFRHPTKLGIVTVSGNLHSDVPKGTLGNILRQAKLK